MVTESPMDEAAKIITPDASEPGLTTFSDHRILEVLAASERTHQKLVRTWKRVSEILSEETGDALVGNVALYGSLSLFMDLNSEQGEETPKTQRQDWPSYYVNSRSDVDFVVELKRDVAPEEVAARLQKEGWRMEGQTQVRKFATTQYTLVVDMQQLEEDDEQDVVDTCPEVYLDITCIESPLHFERFTKRQEAFKEAFHEVRARLEGEFQQPGALAFDAYIHLLKAFAAKVPGNALTGFQATCIGLFALQLQHYRLKTTQSIALSLFEGFLRFCSLFYSDISRASWHNVNYRFCAIDLSGGGRWLPRASICWRSEMYFMETEVKMNTPNDERLNIAHSLVPAQVAAEAQSLLTRAFAGGFDWDVAFTAAAAS